MLIIRRGRYDIDTIPDLIVPIGPGVGTLSLDPILGQAIGDEHRHGRSLRSDELVDQILEHLLPAARVGGDVALGEDIGFEVGEGALAGLDPAAELAVPALVPLLDEGGEPAVLLDRV